MEATVEVMKFYLGLLNLALALYFLWTLYSSPKNGRPHSFSKTMQIMLVAGVMFAVLQAASVFRLFEGVALEAISDVAVMMLLLVLITAAIEMRKGMLAHDHLMRRRLRGRLSDVE